MATTKTSTKPSTSAKTPVKSTTRKPAPAKKPDGVTLEQALKDEGEGRTPETINKPAKSGTSKVSVATKIMEEMWPQIQSGKVKRKDVIQRFIDEVPLTKAGASTYYGNIKSKMEKR